MEYIHEVIHEVLVTGTEKNLKELADDLVNTSLRQSTNPNITLFNSEMFGCVVNHVNLTPVMIRFVLYLSVPAHAFMKALSDIYPELHIYTTYHEENLQYAGYMKYENGVGDCIKFDSSTPDILSGFLSDEFDLKGVSNDY